ncbi:Sulfite exporter TauE/SafE [Salinivirga cyanobacteriivorans]|uniref:Probable membrane transporter protein n=1 Tax=Salinivirga cyanobacteriivorans TaxID=1307839 RepID=A0A0S2HZT9_9BACT|nr:sulfite exporter TauE/SafE family protein [Salinivirga cyanobacteriivorans]ALO15578.1 Sulfite exporter TauE/SafE [Salinivirga cyanobacteriivorans]
MEIVWIILIVLLASLIKGITGFGFAMVSLPLLMFWYSPLELIPVLMISNLLSSALILLQKKEQKLVSKPFKGLILFGAIFTILGVVALNFISEDHLAKFVALFFILLSGISLLKVRYHPVIKKPWYKLAGALCGFLTGCISISGPPLALFLNFANAGKQQFREIFAWFSLITAIIALIGYYFSGLLTAKSLEMSALFLPLLFIGSFLGKRLNKKVPTVLFRQFSIAMSLVSCVVLLLG